MKSKMKIDMHEITVREVFNGYKDSAENGVVAYGGKLNVRPAFQREFIYKDEQRNEVIRTIRNGFPLNVMYWSVSEEGYELMDGQQRTISICQYINGEYSIDSKYFHSLTVDEQNEILGYKLNIYICEGSEREKLEWFKIINIAGEKLTDQELRNAIYTGTWLADAKKKFSKTNCVGYKRGNKYMKGEPIRQAYLETVLDWISSRDGMTIEDYMSKHQKDSDASKLWLYFSAVMDWVEARFPKYDKKTMQGLNWGLLYNEYGEKDYDNAELAKRVDELMGDYDVTKKSGIYEFVLSGEAAEKRRLLSIRAFDEPTKKAVYKAQEGKCIKCGNPFKYEEMEGDHITPWHEGGHTTKENCQMLCKNCNRTKSGK